MNKAGQQFDLPFISQAGPSPGTQLDNHSAARLPDNVQLHKSRDCFDLRPPMQPAAEGAVVEPMASDKGRGCQITAFEFLG